MKIYREIDIQNPFTMCNILNDTAWSNCYLLQKKDLLDEVESILEETEMTEEQLNDFFAYDVETIFPDVFAEDSDEDEEDEDEEEDFDEEEEEEELEQYAD